MKTQLRVLIVEDSESDARLIVRQLQRAGFGLEYERVETAGEMKTALAKQDWDLVIADYNLPRFSGPAALETLKERALDIPFIVVSATIGEENAVAMMKSGAHDYIMKDNLARLAPAVERELREAEGRRERRQGEAALINSETTLRTVLKGSPSGIGLVVYRVFKWVNDELLNLTGYSQEELIGHNSRIFYFSDAEYKRVGRVTFAQIQENGWGEVETQWRRKDGTPVEIYVNTVAVEPGDLSAGVVFTAMDITARKRTESELKLKEKLLDSASDSIFLHDLDGNFLYMNEAAYITRWYSQEELLSLGAWGLVTPEAAVYQDDIRKELWANGELIFESEHRRKDGSVIPVEIFARVLAVEGRELILSVARDITERHKAEEALRQSRETLRVLLDATPAGVMLLDPRHIVLAANRVAAERLGKTVTDLVGTDTFDYLPPELARSRKDRLEEIKRSGNPAIFEDSRGGLFFDNYVHPILSPTGGVAGLAVLSVDITDRKRAEETLLLDEARLEALVNLSQMSGASLRGLANFALEEGVRLTKSKIGYLAFMNEDETVLTMYAWSRHAMDQCAIYDKPIEYPLETTGQWGEAVRQRRPVIINDFAAPRPDKKGYPSGHLEVLRHMNLPVFDGQRIVAVAGVGNKEEPYNASDVRQLTLLMDGMWNLVQRSQAETALKESLSQLHRTLDSTAMALATTVEMRDPYTAGHQKRVALLVCAIGQEMGFSADQLEGMRVMGMLHDIGKIAVPAEILSRPGKISETEFNIIKVHSQVGYDITKDIEFPWPVAQGIPQHHERLDGSGYPHGLKGDEIILEGKILAVADVVEAMSSHRPYRPTLGIDKALEEITRNKGIRYDSEVVDVCVRLFTGTGFQFD
jgi:PAS domain S-box-containing protein